MKELRDHHLRARGFEPRLTAVKIANRTVEQPTLDRAG